VDSVALNSSGVRVTVGSTRHICALKDPPHSIVAVLASLKKLYKESLSSCYYCLEFPTS